MTRIVPGSGAVIEPIFNDQFGVKAVTVLNGGQNYDSSDPPRLTVTGCGTPVTEALLYPIIDDDSGKIIHVRVLAPGKGYDPVRLSIVPEQDTPNVVSSFDINRIWQSDPNSQTTGTFLIQDNDITDRLVITSDNHPKPTNFQSDREPGGGALDDQVFDNQFIYRGGKDVPNPNERPFEINKSIGIMANGVLLHTPDWGSSGLPPVGFNFDIVPHDYLLNTNVYDAVVQDNQYYYHTNKLINEFSLDNGVFENGLKQQFTWRVKRELDNVLLYIDNIDETTNSIEEGRLVERIGDEVVRGQIAKIVKVGDVVDRIYLRDVEGNFSEGDKLLGSTGFSATVRQDPVTFSNGLFYIEFGPEASEFGPFVPGTFYLAPENIKVKRNYQIIWDQSDSSNQPSDTHPNGHPMRFSTTPDGPLNQTPGTLYYNSTGVTQAPAADYENEFRPVFLMNADESNRIYYHCAYHNHMSGYSGDEGYMILDTAIDDDPLPNNYYTQDFFRGYQEVTTDNFSNYNYVANNIILLSDGDGTGDSGGFNIGSHFFYNGTGVRELSIDLDLTRSQQIQVKIIRGNDSNGGEEVDQLTGEELRLEFVDSQYGSTVIGSKFTSGLDTLTTITVGVPSDARIPNSTIRIFQERPSGNNFDNWGVSSIIANIDDGGDSYSRYSGSHSKILGVSYDGYPIYGPYGYNDSNIAARQTSSYRLRTGAEIPGTREKVTTAGTVSYTVTVSEDKFFIDGSEPNFLQLDRGKTYVFNHDTLSSPFLIALAENGWHGVQPTDIGNESYLYQDGISYFIDNVETDYTGYITGFDGATNKRLEFTPRVNSPRALYAISYGNSGYGFRCIQDGYLMGSFVQDYIYEEGLGTLDRHNGRFAVTPEYPNGTYAYFMSTDDNDNPVYPYVIGPEFYGTPAHPGTDLPPILTEFPEGAAGDIILNEDGSVSYVKMTKNGDGYFGPAQAKIIGGEGSGAVATPVVQTVTGLTLLQEGREFSTPPTLIFEGGGGGQGARGRASIDTSGKVTGVTIVDSGEFYQTPPYILITGGGGFGAKAVARIQQGEIVGIDITDSGKGYVNPPSIIFTKLVNLKRVIRNRQSNNSRPNFLTGLTKSIDADDTSIIVDNTDSYPGSGQFIIGNETISYASKSRERFLNLTRGINFNYDQRVIIDASQNNSEGLSTYKFSVGDILVRRVDNANNKLARVYDWDPATRALLVTFEVDELAFIDAGIPSTEDAIVQFDAGVAASAPLGFDPHVIVVSIGNNIVTLTNPIGVLTDSAFEDDDELGGLGDGIADLVNTNTDYENQINLDGGLHNTLYGIEETQGGQNTTLFTAGEQVKDASLPFKYATITEVGGLSEGVPHEAILSIYLDITTGTGNYFVDEIVTGSTSGVSGTVVGWDSQTGLLTVSNVVPFDTGNLSVGVNGILYKFSDTGTIVDFIIQNPGNDYSAVPSIDIENAGDIQATATAVMTTAGDQIASLTISNGGYGYSQYIDGTYNLRPTVTVTNDVSDTTGNGAVIQAIFGGEVLAGNNGASYRIKSIDYNVQIISS